MREASDAISSSSSVAALGTELASRSISVVAATPRYGAATASFDFYHPDGYYTTEATFVNSSRFILEYIKRVYDRRKGQIEWEVREVSLRRTTCVMTHCVN
jgi:hypothetical protein